MNPEMLQHGARILIEHAHESPKSVGTGTVIGSALGLMLGGPVGLLCGAFFGVMGGSAAGVFGLEKVLDKKKNSKT